MSTNTSFLLSLAHEAGLHDGVSVLGSWLAADVVPVVQALLRQRSASYSDEGQTHHLCCATDTFPCCWVAAASRTVSPPIKTATGGFMVSLLARPTRKPLAGYATAGS
jgi:hypothetical protein